MRFELKKKHLYFDGLTFFGGDLELGLFFMVKFLLGHHSFLLGSVLWVSCWVLRDIDRIINVIIL